MGAVVFLRFWAAAAALWLTATVVGGMSLTPLAALLLAVVLAGIGAIMARLWPLHGPRSLSLAGWLASSVVLWAAQWVIPDYHISPTAAIGAGGLLWLLDQLFPSIFG